MSTFYFNVNDPKDRIEDIVRAPAAMQQPDVIRAHNLAAAARKHNWDTRRIHSHGAAFGNPNYTWLAHIPGRIAMLLDLRHHGWDSDEEMMREVLAKYPECRIQPSEER